MKKDRDAYIVLAPAGKSKIYSVAARRIGGRDRFTVITTCISDTIAQQIVDGLRLLQGEVLELSTVAEKTLTDVRLQLVAERERANKISAELGAEKRLTQEAIRQRDAAQKNAREQT